MARTRKTTSGDAPAAGDTTEARVLVDFHHEGERIKAGTLFAGDRAAIEQYAKDGLVDAHPDAVAYVKAQQG